MIEPHGGKLVNNILTTKETDEIYLKESAFCSLKIGTEKVKDVRNIARGVYSPLSGFLKKNDFESVVKEMRLTNGDIWPIPIVLDISKDDKDKIGTNKDLILMDYEFNPVAIMTNIEIFEYDKDFFAKKVYKTLNREHPGVENIYEMGEYLVGGEIKLLDDSFEYYPEHNFTPVETREIFEKKNWKTIVAFQTRNVPHRGHEFLQKAALEKTDGLFIQPVIGKKKVGDFKDEYIIASYELLIDKFFPKGKAFLGILPLRMRYAGPREAVFHAIIRQNFGCTHFIVGRDHAGVGDYYGPFEAQEIFDKFKVGELKIEIMKFPEIVFSNSKNKHTFIDETPESDRAQFSGTKLRGFIEKKEQPPEHILRPEIFNFLINSHNSLVDDNYNKNMHHGKKGFVLWLTGFSQSGKTTTANKVCEILDQKGIKIERLDGDVVRESLTKDLGFSKEDRDENIRRVGFVAKMLSKNGVGVISSFISPYQAQRDALRKECENFIEVYVATPLEVCEKRDTRGLYAKARAGKLENFTGINDPYEEPENPEIIIRPDKDGVDICAQQVITYLEENSLI